MCLGELLDKVSARGARCWPPTRTLWRNMAVSTRTFTLVVAVVLVNPLR